MPTTRPRPRRDGCAGGAPRAGSRGGCLVWATANVILSEGWRFVVPEGTPQSPTFPRSNSTSACTSRQPASPRGGRGPATAAPGSTWHRGRASVQSFHPRLRSRLLILVLEQSDPCAERGDRLRSAASTGGTPRSGATEGIVRCNALFAAVVHGGEVRSAPSRLVGHALERGNPDDRCAPVRSAELRPPSDDPHARGGALRARECPLGEDRDLHLSAAL